MAKSWDTWVSLGCRNTNENIRINTGAFEDQATDKNLLSKLNKMNSFQSGPSQSLTPDPVVCN